MHLHYYRDTDQREIDLVIESGDSLYPIEFKKTAAPSKNDIRHFAALDKLGKKTGDGAVICFVAEDLPITREVSAIPVQYI